MLRSIKLFYGDTLRATDGEIGQIKDFYFDDQNWVVRYMVVDTGTWLPGRQVLLSPHIFTNFDLDGVCRDVNLTRQQIAGSPAIASHMSVSRQFEEEYYRYYGWSRYWEGGELWGDSAYPTVETPVDEQWHGPGVKTAFSAQDHDSHLRSTLALNGYQIQTDEGAIGHVTDFIVDHGSWGIRHVVVRTGHWFSGKEIVIAPNEIDRICYEESKVFVSLTRESILKAPRYQVFPWAFCDPPIANVQR